MDGDQQLAGAAQDRDVALLPREDAALVGLETNIGLELARVLGKHRLVGGDELLDEGTVDDLEVGHHPAAVLERPIAADADELRRNARFLVDTEKILFDHARLLDGKLQGKVTTDGLFKAFRAFGLQQAGLWGVLAGIFNSIPYFGPVLVTAATATVAFLQFGNVQMPLLVGGTALAITSLEGMLLTPWLTSRAARMNAVAVFVGLLFWGWLWSVWGMLLAVPMLMVVKAISDHVEDLKPIGELLVELGYVTQNDVLEALAGQAGLRMVQIDYSSIPEAAFKAATTKPAEPLPKSPSLPNAKEVVSLRIDRDVLDYFQEGGQGWQERINAALRKAAGK